MPLVFDPVHAGPLHRQYQLLRERLELVFPPERFLHAMVPAKLTPGVWKSLVQRTPFVGLGFIGLQGKKEAGRILDSSVIWDLYLVASNIRAAERLLGDAQGPGGFGMLSVAIYALQGWTIAGDEPGTASGTVSIMDAGHGYLDGDADEQRALIKVSLSVGLYWRNPVQLDEFLRTHVVWDFPVPAAVTDDNEVRSP